MIALRIVVQNYSFPRRNFICGVKSNTKGISAIKKRLVLYEDLHRESKILKLFWKHVKPKKRHEINIMAEVIHNTALVLVSFLLNVFKFFRRLLREHVNLIANT